MPGEFFALGPAFKNENGIVRARIRQVLTTHPRPGKVAPPTPPARGRIREMLAELADLQVEAKKEVDDLEAARAKITLLEQRLTVANLPGEPVERIVEVEKVVERRIPFVPPEMIASIQSTSKMVHDLAAFARAVAFGVDDILKTTEGGPNEDKAGTPAAVTPVTVVQQPVQTSAPTPASAHAPASVQGFDRGARDIFHEVAFAHPAPLSRRLAATLTVMKPEGSSFRTYLSKLRSAGLVSVSGPEIRLTQAGLESFEGRLPNMRSRTLFELTEAWLAKFDRGAREILQILIEKDSAPVKRTDLAKAIGVIPEGSSFRTYLSSLRSSGLIETHGDLVRANAEVFR
jgi:hypothetical protein